MSSAAEGVHRASKGGYVFIWESVPINHYVLRDCNLRQVEQTVDFLSYAMVMAKDSTYKEEISEAILKLIESEQLYNLREKYVVYICA